MLKLLDAGLIASEVWHMLLISRSVFRYPCELIVP